MGEKGLDGNVFRQPPRQDAAASLRRPQAGESRPAAPSRSGARKCLRKAQQLDPTEPQPLVSAPAERSLGGRGGRSLFSALTREGVLPCRTAFDVAFDSHSIVLNAEDLLLKNHKILARSRWLPAATAKMRLVVGAPAASSVA